MTFLWTLVIFGVLVVLFRKIINLRSKISKWNKILNTLPGPPRWPLLGHLYLFAGLKQHEYFGAMDKIASKFRHVGCFVLSLSDLGPKMAYMITAETASKVLQNTDHLEKGYGYPMIAEYLGDGLVTSKPKKWKHRRELINTAFTFKMFDNFIRIFNEQSLVMVQLLHDKFDHIENENEGFQDISTFFTRCSLDIILEAAAGTKVEAQTNEFSEIHHAMEIHVTIKDDVSETLRVPVKFSLLNTFWHSGIKGVSTRMYRPWYRAKWLYWNLPEGRKMAKLKKHSHDFTRNIIRQRIKERQDGTVGYSDGPKTFLDIILDAADTDKSLDMEGITEETITIGAAGHDTVATAINFVLFMMATHPNHQKGVQEELETIFSKDNHNGYISSADLSQMKYLERFVKETLRLYPAVSGFMRRLQSELHLDNGIVLPKGLEASILISVLHKDPKAFPDPEKFDPDRFLPENCVGRHPCAFIPFSAGPRNCIGQKFGLLEVKLLVASVLRDFNVKTIDKAEDLKLIPSITLILVNPIRMKLVPRVIS